MPEIEVNTAFQRFQRLYLHGTYELERLTSGWPPEKVEETLKELRDAHIIHDVTIPAAQTASPDAPRISPAAPPAKPGT